MNDTIVNTLKEVDHFHKNCQLLFDDLKASIQEKTLQATFIPLTDDSWSGVNTTNSEHRRHFIFDHDGRIRFAMMLVKVKEDQIRGRSTGFKAVCQQLGIDVVFPLILVTGVFEPRNTQRFRNDANVRRNWVYHTLLLDVSDNIHLADPNTYCLNENVTVLSQEGTDSWWCEKAIFKIRRLVDIKDSQAVEGVAEDLLKL